jgi:CBS domain-containing protein
MFVREIMTTDVVTVNADATLREGVGLMLREGIGSLVVTSDGVPAGIVTHGDVLRATYATRRPLAQLAVRKAASGDLVTVAPDATVGSAVSEMTSHDVAHLPVVDDFEVVGIVTTTDLVVHYPEIVSEAGEAGELRALWESR